MSRGTNRKGIQCVGRLCIQGMSYKNMPTLIYNCDFGNRIRRIYDDVLWKFSNFCFFRRCSYENKKKT